MRKFLNTVIAVVAVAAAFATPASADPIFVDGITGVQVQTIVDVRGLDAGQADRLIDRAARRVCGEPDNRSISEFARVNDCRSAAAAGARQQLARAPGATNVMVAAIY